MSVLGNVLLVACGLALLWSAARKSREYRAFVTAVSAYQPRFRPSLAFVWVAAEAGAGVALLVPGGAARVIPATWLLATATGAVARRVHQGETHDCGCHSKPRPISARALVGNSVLIGVGVAAAGWTGRPDAAMLAAAGAGVAFAVGYFSVGASDRASDSPPEALEPVESPVL